MDAIQHLAVGLGVALEPVHLLCAVLGYWLGMRLAALPGLGTVAAMALVLPITYGWPALPALVALTGVLAGARVPVVAASGARVVLAACLAAGAGALGVALVLPWLVQWAALLAPADTFALMVLALSGAVVAARGGLLTALGMAMLGVLLGLVGMDGASGVVRFAMDVPDLSQGIGLVALALGVFVCGQALHTLAHATPKQDLSLPPRLTLGHAATNSRRAVAAVAWHHAVLQSAWLPLFALGIPSHAAMALLMGAMVLHGAAPGGTFAPQQPALVWGLVVSLWLGSLVLALGLPWMVRWSGRARWLRLPNVPPGWLFPALVLGAAVGAYSLRGSSLDVWLVGALGVLGYGFQKLSLDPGPLLMGFVLGPALEDRLRSALQLAAGDWGVLAARPVSGTALAVALGLVVVSLLPVVARRRARGHQRA
jgi:putative tricarboxylic transport membrane protein